MKKPDSKPVALDFFCGAGGLSLGFHQAGFRVVAAFDIDPIHAATYALNFPDTRVAKVDVSTLTAAQVRSYAGLKEEAEIDVIYGGPPCQGFSLIGKRETDDPRNLLLLSLANLVAQLKPRYFVIENVSGLVLGSARNLLAKALRSLRSAGYRWVTPIRVLNACDYGVPQKRKRVIILGYRRGASKPSYPRKSRVKVTVREAICDLYAVGRRKSLFSSDQYAGKLGQPSSYSLRLRNTRSSDASLTGCRLCAHEQDVVERFRKVAPGAADSVSRFVKLRLRAQAPTLRAGTGKDKGSFTAPRPIHPTQSRCITVREAARLHSFPDWFQFHQTQWHGFRQIGNSVPPRLAMVVAKSLTKAMK
jgi:DNA (cytosine-5)-methyltransferase 1